MLTLFLIIAAIFGPIAGVMAYLITYEEYSHHFLDRREVIGRSLTTALVTVAFFVVLFAIVGYLLDHRARSGSPL